MAVNRKALAEAERALRRQSVRASEELRALRIRSGLSQAAVAREVGIARSVVSRLEAGDPGITLRTRFRVASVLGADLRLTAFVNSGSLIRDAVQAAIVEWILASAGRHWGPRVEAAVPGPGRRSVDLLLELVSDIVLLEVESRLTSLEEIVRELHSKRQAFADTGRSEGEARAARTIHVVLVLPRTRHHRSIVEAHPRTVRAAFPTPSSELARALAGEAGRCPGDGILWVPAAARTGPPLVPRP